MNEMNCDRVRDVLPDRLAGRLDDIALSGIARHLAECEECRAEATLLEHLREPASVPFGLETRVLAAVRSGRRSALPFRFPATRHFAMAATVVFALVTASLLVRRDHSAPADDSFWADATDDATLVWSAYDDPLVPGSAGLNALSVDELEQVLKEMER
jgi:anti-sigma factor RsiW